MFRIRRKSILHTLLTGILFGFCVSCQQTAEVRETAAAVVEPGTQISVWLSTPDKSVLFQKQDQRLAYATAAQANLPAISLEPAETFQSMAGFGYTLTGGSAQHIYRMSSDKRRELLRELFSTSGNSIGVSYLRISLGASDLDEKPFSYNDLPVGQTDPTLASFSLEPDKKYLIPLLREILEIDPQIKIMASPWSPPVWMKTNGDTRGGSLKHEYFPLYAQYFVKYLQGMAAEGIPVDAITVQNEPLHPGNNPSLYMPAEEQALFIKKHLGPALKEARLKTKIIIYDHNADRPDYPITILNDPEAKQWVDGSAFHLYGGVIEALSDVHNAHPDKHIYFTEQWIGAPGNFPVDLAWHLRELIIGAPRNWSRTVLEWNLAADPQHKPHTDRGGCDRCLGALTIDGDAVVRNPAYYIIAHAAKFVRPGSLRIASNIPEGLPNVAFKTPEGKLVLIVLNDSKKDQEFLIQANNERLTASLRAGAVATYVWP